MEGALNLKNIIESQIETLGFALTLTLTLTSDKSNKKTKTVLSDFILTCLVANVR